MDCRICMESIFLDDAVGNLCHCKEVFFHENCAVQWFTPRIHGISKGKALQEHWSTQWYASCEVCKQPIDDAIVQKCLFNLKKESFKRLQKSMNPISLPHSVNQNHSRQPQRHPLRTHPVVVNAQPRSVIQRSRWGFLKCFTPQEN